MLLGEENVNDKKEMIYISFPPHPMLQRGFLTLHQSIMEEDFTIAGTRTG